MRDEATLISALSTLTESDHQLQKEAAKILVQKLKIIPHHAISLARNKYRVIRKVSRCVKEEKLRGNSGLPLIGG
jgi:hypothetical protein